MPPPESRRGWGAQLKHLIERYSRVLWFALATAAAPAWADSTSVVTISEENDLFTPERTDNHYTQGLKISLFSGEVGFSNLVETLNRGLPAVGLNVDASRVGWVILGQQIYTPGQLALRDPDPLDRPYAGWLYSGVFFQRASSPLDRLPVLESFEVNLGMVGPASLAAQSQKTVHRWDTSSTFPRGWDHQLRNEPGLVLKYARLWRVAVNDESSRYVDLVPRVGAAVGNVLTAAGAGATLRVGYELPQDFGLPLNDSFVPATAAFEAPPPRWGFYLFGGLGGRAVARNIFLDGNSFRDGPSVEKNLFVADLSYGVVLAFGRNFSLSYTHVTRTEEFKGQKGQDVFGSITGTVRLAF